MLAHSDLQRSIAHMSISLARRVERRRGMASPYRLTEREEQFQYEVAGTCGVLPAETVLKIPFGVIFITDSGNQRDSVLDRPQVRIGFEVELGPAGIIPYAHVASWTFDPDFNIVGATMTIGVHCPAIAIEGLLPSTASDYKASMHVAFQGWAAPIDADGGFDMGANLDLPGVAI